MDDDPSRARGRRRPSSELLRSSGSVRRTGDDIPISEQPREKIHKRENSSSSGSANGRSPNIASRGELSSVPRLGSDPPEPPGTGGRGGKQRTTDRYEIAQTRPKNVPSKCGKLGKEIVLQTNYFRLLTKPTWRIFQYHTDFQPPIELKRIRSGVLSEHKEILGGYIFDGTKIFSTTKLRDDKIELITKSRNGETYKITVKFVGVISMTEWQSLQVLNLILRRAMEGLKLQLVGRNFFDAIAKIDIREHRLQLWPGYITSIRQHEKDILVCTEIAHKVMRTETVYDILMKATQESRDYQDNFKRQVIGLTVLTDYNNKTYRIDDVDFSKSPKDTFKCKESDTSFSDYYYKKYNIRIRDQHQPLLLSKTKERQIRGGQSDIVILIPELCRATGITEAMRSNFQLTRAMSDHTRMGPEKRIDRLRTFNRRLQDTESSMKVLQDWNMNLDRNLMELRGRVIDPQSIVFLDKRKVSAGDNADWTRQFRDNPLFNTPSRGLANWTVITPGRNSRDSRNFVESLIRAANGMRLEVKRPKEFVIPDDRNHSYLNAIEESARLDPQLILCLVPNNNAERYSTIKKKTCVERAIPTQVVTSKTATNQRGLMSVCTKVAIQINCKLGYAPWMVDMPLSGLMTIGYDIARSTKDKAKAYGALVATMDMKVNSTFYSTVSPCHAADDLSNELSVSVIKALRRYQHEHNGDLPTRIMLYRDGVGEGSINQLMEHEVKPLVNRLEDIYGKRKDSSGELLPPQKLMFAYIVVSKTINTRFFAHGRNPPPGTVVDDVVTLPERYDFYLVSQSVRQGTVSPTSYNVVHSTIGLDPDRMQILTYKMTHLYYNWSGTTRVPAVCQYAKKLATLVAQSIHHTPSTALEKKLFYL